MFTHIVSPRFSDIDGFKHVNHLAIPAWFESGREFLYRIFSPEYDLDVMQLILVHMGVDYLNQMYLGTEVEIRTYTRKIGNSSFHAYQEAWQRENLCAQGDVVLVHFDFQTGKSMRIPEDYRRKLEEHLYPEP
ncbi:MAG: acyl-CoA thioesterase [Planctomycetaceae bacterium]|jgi:acyl-CoA thioester hydrolase|nr:acyl-CoA thioesterase [Planctomycetaceae bacterium]